MSTEPGFGQIGVLARPTFPDVDFHRVNIFYSVQKHRVDPESHLIKMEGFFHPTPPPPLDFALKKSGKGKSKIVDMVKAMPESESIIPRPYHSIWLPCGIISETSRRAFWLRPPVLE